MWWFVCAVLGLIGAAWGAVSVFLWETLPRAAFWFGVPWCLHGLIFSVSAVWHSAREKETGSRLWGMIGVVMVLHFACGAAFCAWTAVGGRPHPVVSLGFVALLLVVFVLAEFDRPGLD